MLLVDQALTRSSNTTFYSIQQAINSSKPNDTIYIMSGIYREQIQIKDKHALTIVAAPGAEVIIDGSIPIDKSLWKKDKPIFSTYQKKKFTYYTAKLSDVFLNNKPRANKYLYLYDADGNALWKYNNYDRFESHYVHHNNGEGFCVEGEKIYVHLHNKNLDEESLFLSRPGHVVNIINCSDLYIGAGQGSLIIKNGSRRNVLVSSPASKRKGPVTLKGINILNAKIGITLANNTNPVIVDDCQLTHLSNLAWTWNEMKNVHTYIPKIKGAIAYMESIGVLVSGDSQHADILNCKVSGYFNGIVVIAGNTRLENNEVYDIKDDALELEGELENVIVRNNFIYNSFRSISAAPVTKGPVYISNNIFSQSRKSFSLKYNYETRKVEISASRTLKVWSRQRSKLSKKEVEVTRNVHFYNNTFYSNDNPFELGGPNSDYHPVDCSFINNVFISKNKLFNEYSINSKSVVIEKNLFIKISQNEANNDVKILKNSGAFKNNCLLVISPFSGFEPSYRQSFKLSEKTKEKLNKINFNYDYNNSIRLNKYPGALLSTCF